MPDEGSTKLDAPRKVSIAMKENGNLSRLALPGIARHQWLP